jgi:hypothetical protein
MSQRKGRVGPEDATASSNTNRDGTKAGSPSPFEPRQAVTSPARRRDFEAGRNPALSRVHSSHCPGGPRRRAQIHQKVLLKPGNRFRPPSAERLRLGRRGATSEAIFFFSTPRRSADQQSHKPLEWLGRSKRSPRSRWRRFSGVDAGRSEREASRRP